MPRIIGAEKNEIIYADPLSGCNLGLYYRMPTTEEREGFLNAAVKRKGNKVTLHHAEARMAFGLKILVGVRDGDFLRRDGGKDVPMSSNPDSPDYCPEWKQEMESGCADLVMAMAAHVFDSAPRIVAGEEEEDLAGE